MRKLILLLIMCLSVAQVCVAQDVIVTRDSKFINASVKEISDTEIRYKRQDNPDGPVFVIRTSEVSSILFANGEVQSFENAIPLPTESSTAVESQGNSYDYSNAPVVVSNGHLIRYTPGVQLKYEGFKMSYNGVELDNNACEAFLKATCQDAYKKYMEAYWVGLVGKAFVYAGDAFIAVGLIYGLAAEPDATTTESDIEANTTSYLAAGLCGYVIALPFYVGMYSLKTKAVEKFNNRCSYRPQLASAASLSVKVSPCAVGLALNF